MQELAASGELQLLLASANAAAKVRRCAAVVHNFTPADKPIKDATDYCAQV